MTDLQEEDEDAILRLYEILVESTSEVTNWRQSANRFYLAVCTTLASTAFLAADVSTAAALVMALIGLAVAVMWYQNIQSYALLNEAKFKVVHELEDALPSPIFTKEYDYFNAEKGAALTTVEARVPVAFGVGFLLIAVILVGLLVSFV